MNDPDDREIRFCRHAWEEGSRRGRVEGLMVGFALGVGAGALIVVALVARLG